MGANPGHAHAQPHPPDFGSADIVYPVPDAPAGHYPPNAPVLYFSQFETGGPRWIAATVLHFSPFTGLYTLDCKDDVEPSQLRPVDSRSDPMAPPPPPPPAFGSDPMASPPPPAFNPLGEAPPSFLQPISFTCKYCHRMLPLDATCCPGCGHPAELRPREFVQSPAHLAPPPPEFTPAQMAPQAAPSQNLASNPSNICHNCGQVFRPGAQFCDKCGCRAQATPAFLPEVPSTHEQVLPEAPPQHRQPAQLLPPPLPVHSGPLAGSQPVQQQDPRPQDRDSPRGLMWQQDRTNDSGSVRDLIQRGLEEQRRREQEQQDQPINHAITGPSQRRRSATGSRSSEEWSDRSSQTSEVSGAQLPPPPAPSRRRATIQEDPALQRASRTPQADPEELRENMREMESDDESERSELYDGNGSSSSGASDQRRHRTNHTGTNQRHQSSTTRAQERRENRITHFCTGMRVERRVRGFYQDGLILEAGATGTIIKIAPDGRDRRVTVDWDASGSRRGFYADVDIAKIQPLEEQDQGMENGLIVYQPDYERSLRDYDRSSLRDYERSDRSDYSDYEVIRGASAGTSAIRQAGGVGGTSGTGAGTSTGPDSKNECTLFAHIDVYDASNFLAQGSDRFKTSCQKAIADIISEVIQIHPDRVQVKEVKNFRSEFRKKRPEFSCYGPAALNNHGKTLFIEIPGTVLQSHGGPFTLPIRELREIQRALFYLSVPNAHNGSVQIPEFFRRVNLLGTPSIGTSLFTKTVDPFMGTTLAGTASLSHINVYRFITLPPASASHRQDLLTACTDLQTALLDFGMDDLKVAYRSSTKVTRSVAGGHYKLEAEVSRPTNMLLAQVKECMRVIEDRNWRIEAAICHEGTHLNLNDNTPIQVCAHVDIRGENPARGFIGGDGVQGWQNKFERALRRLAMHRGIEGELNIDMYELYEIKNKPAAKKDGDARGTKKERDKEIKKARQQVWHVDFMVSITHGAHDIWDRRVDLRAVQDLLWALNRKEIKDWGKDLPTVGLTAALLELNVAAKAFFANNSLENGVRICANDPNTDSQNTPNGPQCTFVSEIDIVDCKSFFENSGPLAFANLLSDALHIIAGIPAPRITILDAKKKKTDQLPNHDKAKRYTVHVEVGFVEHKPEKMQMQRVYDYMWHLHSEIIRRRWAQLPFFKHYIVEGGVQVYYPRNVRRDVQAIEPQKSVPKLRAHIDVIDYIRPNAEPFLQQQGESMNELAKAFRSMLNTTLDISEECIKVTCIRKRPVHVGRAELIQRLYRTVFHEVEERQFGESRGCGATMKGADQIHRSLRSIQDDTRLQDGLVIPRDIERWLGYTLEFEVMAPSSATNSQARERELDRLREKLRKLHSAAIWRRHNGSTLTNSVEFLQNFLLDVGVQIDFAAHPSYGRFPQEDHVEDYMYPDEAGPVIVYPSFKHLGDPYFLKEHHVLIRAHVDIVYKAEADQVYVGDECIDGPYSEESIRTEFEQALHAHMGDLYDDAPWDRDDPGTQSKFKVIGVQKKAAHCHKLAKFYLERGSHGVDRVRLERTQGYTVNFELRCRPEMMEDFQGPGLAQQPDMLDHLWRILARLRNWVTKSLQEPPPDDFFDKFAFDHGVMIDDSEQQGLATFSMSHLAIRTSMTFTRRGGSNYKQLEENFPHGMAAALGTCAKQIQKVKVREGGDNSTATVDFEVNTLTPNPAKQEFESLMQKLRALTLQCNIPGRWWMELFPNWKPVSVIPGQQVANSYEEDEVADREVCEADEEHQYVRTEHWTP